LVLFACCRESK